MKFAFVYQLCIACFYPSSNDLLDGQGYFQSMPTLLEPNYITHINNCSLTLQKTHNFTFDDGIMFQIQQSNASHLSFKCAVSSASQQVEGCSVRLFQRLKTESCLNQVLAEPSPKTRLSTFIFFRMSFYNQIKFNSNVFIDFNYSQNRTYKVDILIDNRLSYLFIDGNLTATEPFYSSDRDQMLDDTCKSQIQSPDTLIVYGLSPGVNTTISELQLCQGLCKNSQPLTITLLGTTTKVTLIILLLSTNLI